MKNHQIDLIWLGTPAGITEEITRKFTELVRKYNPDCLMNSQLVRGDEENPSLLELYDYDSICDQAIPDLKAPLTCSRTAWLLKGSSSGAKKLV